MAAVSLRSRCNDRLRETLVLAHAVGQLHSAELTASLLVGAPRTAGEDGTDNHLHTEALALQSHRHHGIGSSQLPVRTDVLRQTEELSRNLVEHLPFVGYSLGQHHVESRDAVGGHHHNEVVIDIVHVAHLTMVHTLLTLEMKISTC